MEILLDEEFINICISCLERHTTEKLINMTLESQEDSFGSSQAYVDILEYCFGIQMPKIYVTSNLVTGPFMCKICIDKLRNMCIFKNQLQDSYHRVIQMSKVLPGGLVDVKCEIQDEVHFEYNSDCEAFAELKAENTSSDSEPLINISEKKQKQRKKSILKKVKKCDDEGDKGADKKKYSYPLVCQHCGKMLNNKSQFFSHLKSHEGVTQCDICKRVLKKSTLWNHTRTVHKGTLIYTCTHCPMRFKYYHTQQKHLFEEHNIQMRVFECGICSLSFNSSSRRSRHIRKIHLNERPYKCSHCNRAFFDNKDLQSHLLCHSGEKNFECTVCEKRFPRRKSLVEHMKIHLNIKKFKCDICDKAFTQKCTLIGHMKTHERE